ncbi:glycosyltransferase family 9 protein [Paraburkholderia flava]|uniref:glycosyltransferase family 9 protein n=1 Tax=Paraburkholderia flava TaxID=2547393 RepID=UPI001F0CF4B5|nr:glycosyltransferase family 9 protein [Paraburkholderia flava]
MNARLEARMLARQHASTEPQLDKGSLGRVAFSMSNAIGDSLVSMIIVRNLMKNGIDVTVYGNPAYALRHWFPEVAVRRLPTEEDSASTFAEYDTVLQMQWNQPLVRLLDAHPRVRTLHDVEFGEHPGCMAERFADFCRNELALDGVDLGNGIAAPAGLQHRRHSKRIVIHPEASTDDKRWPAERFVKLARRLQKKGYEPHFVIAPHERARWKDVQMFDIPVPVFDDLGTLAAWVYESGYFIGNDSGIGHLASNLDIPAVSLFRRRGVAARWRPVWGAVEVILPWQWVPTSRLKERFWKETLTCSRVMAAFMRMTSRYPVPASQSA